VLSEVKNFESTERGNKEKICVYERRRNRRNNKSAERGPSFFIKLPKIVIFFKSLKTL
jgi:hypothetical protein